MAKYHTPDPKGGPYASPHGHVYPVQQYHESQQKARDNPAALTDLDLGIIESFGGTPEADRAAEKREKALQPRPLAAPTRQPATPDRAMSIEDATAIVLKALSHRRPGRSFDRDKFAAGVRAKRARQLPIVVGEYDPVAFLTAHAQLKADPSRLTDGDIHQLSIVSIELGEEARARRTGYVKGEKSEPADDSMARLPMSVRAMLAWEEHIEDALFVPIKTVIRLAREAHARADLLEQRLAALDDGLKSAPPGPIELKAITARLEALERRGGFEYHGVFKEGTLYRKGDSVTWGGHLWICRAAMTTDRPKFSEDSGQRADARVWSLACKAGRDGKDLR